MERLTVDPEHPQPAALARAASVLAAGGLVAFPTETVYGLGARALHEAEVARIFEAKGRPGWNPLIIHVTGPEQARACVVRAWPPLAETLAAAFWPGPLTLVLPRRPEVPRNVCGDLDTVGVRAPRHPVAMGLLEACGEPLAAPSANRFKHISPTSAEHVVKSLGDRVDLVLDAGPCGVGVESTVVDLSGGMPTVLRPGGVTLAQLMAATPGTAWGRGAPVADGQQRASPGMVARHYAPDARVVMVAHGDLPAWTQAIRELPRPLGLLAFTLPTDGATHAVRLALDPEQAQVDLYGALHVLEDAHCTAMVLEAPPSGAAWEAVLDRLTRAAG